MRKWLSIPLVLVVLACAYTTWPFIGLVQLGHAVQSADAEAALERIDVRAVRRSIINQMLDEGTRDSRIEERYGRIGRSIAVGFAQAVLDERYADVLDLDAVRMLIKDGRFPPSLAGRIEAGGASSAASDIGFSRLPSAPFRHLQRWRFRSPVTFEATIGETGRSDDWTTFRMRRIGFGWTLVGVRLPERIVDRVKPAIRERLAAVGL